MVIILFFLHRAYNSAGRRIDRLFVANARTGEKLRMISDSGMISHYCWMDNNSILAYMKHNDMNGYYIISLSSPSITITKIEIEGLDAYGDGHPTYIGEGKFITDSYPNKSRMKSLLLVDIDNSKFAVLAEFLEPLKFHDQTRCDLHPKWDEVHKIIYVESVHESKRKLFALGPIL